MLTSVHETPKVKQMLSTCLNYFRFSREMEQTLWRRKSKNAESPSTIPPVKQEPKNQFVSDTILRLFSCEFCGEEAPKLQKLPIDTGTILSTVTSARAQKRRAAKQQKQQNVAIFLLISLVFGFGINNENINDGKRHFSIKSAVLFYAEHPLFPLYWIFCVYIICFKKVCRNYKSQNINPSIKSTNYNSNYFRFFIFLKIKK